MQDKKEQDVINPRYYHSDSGIEVIDVIESFKLDFLDGQVIKYILRAGKKNGANYLTDIKKALWYLERQIKNQENRTA